MAHVEMNCVLVVGQSPAEHPPFGLSPEHLRLGPLDYVAKRLVSVRSSPWADVPVMLWCPFGRQGFGRTFSEEGSVGRRLIRFVPENLERMLAPQHASGDSAALWCEQMFQALPALVENFNVNAVYLGDWATVEPSLTLRVFLRLAEAGIARLVVDHSVGDYAFDKIEAQMSNLGVTIVREGRPTTANQEMAYEHFMLAREDLPKWGAALRYTPPDTSEYQDFDERASVGVGLWVANTTAYVRAWHTRMQMWPHKTARLYVGPSALAQIKKGDIIA